MSARRPNPPKTDRGDIGAGLGAIRAAGYVRVSTDEQKKHGWNLNADRERIEAICIERGWQLVEVYDDGGRQGDDPDRPGLLSMLAAVDSYDVLIVRSQDRLTRDTGIWSMITTAFREGNVRVETFTGSLELESPQGELVGNIFAALGRFEKRLIGQRVKQSKVARAHAGGHPGGRRPFGYEFTPTGETGSHGKPIKRLTPHQTEAPVVRRIFDLADSGVSQRQIAHRLNADGLRTTTGALWEQGSVSRIIGNCLYVGMIRRKSNGKWETYPGQHDTLIDRDLFDRVNASRASKPRRAGGRPPRGQHLLRRGILRCTCGAAMIPSTRSENPAIQTYICNARRTHGPWVCQQGSLPRHAVDEALLNELTARYLDLDATRDRIKQRERDELSVARDTLAQAEREAAAAEAAIAKVQRGWREGVIDDDDYAEQRQQVIEERDAAHAAAAQARARLAAVENDGTAIDAEKRLLAHLADLKEAVAGSVERAPDLAALRTIIAQLIERVDVGTRTHPFGQPADKTSDGVLHVPRPPIRFDDDGEPLQEDLDALGPAPDLWLWITVRREFYDFDARAPRKAIIDVPEEPTRSSCRRR